MSRKTIAIVNAAVVAVMIAGASQASAQQQDNPLHPAYFANKSAAVNITPNPHNKPYADSRNPLHPSYVQAGDTAWRGAAATTQDVAYFDAHNPLHPAFARY
jgi:hypothetical protein